jgi:hypothetical protein
VGARRLSFSLSEHAPFGREAEITGSASTRAWAIARRARPTKQNARGIAATIATSGAKATAKSRFPAQRPHAHKSRLVGKAAGDRHIWTRRYALAVRPGAAGGDGVIGRCGGDDCVAGLARKLFADVPHNLEPGRHRYRSVPASRPTRDMQAGIGRDRRAAKLKRSKSSLGAPPSASPGGPPFPSRLALSTLLTLIAESPEPR